MLGKLLKYEMKSTSRVMWFLYAAVIIVGTIIGFMLHINANGDMYIEQLAEGTVVPRLAAIIFIFVYALLLVGLAIMTIIMIILRFNNNLLKGEGYLMHTLPVPTWMHVLSKLIISFIWIIIGFLASVISALMLGLTSGILPYILKNGNLEEFFRDYWELLGSPSVLFIVNMIVAAVMLILVLYFSMSVGNIANRHKFLLAVGTFIGVIIVTSIISTAVGSTAVQSMLEDVLSSPSLVRRSVNGLLIKDIILDAVYAAACYFGTTMIMKKRLNLA